MLPRYKNNKTTEKRVQRRTHADEKIILAREVFPSIKMPATLINFSDEGVALITDDSFQEAEVVIISCRGSFLIGNVRTCERINAQHFRVGVQLERLQACAGLVRELKNAYRKKERSQPLPLGNEKTSAAHHAGSGMHR
ncbi:MAG TPA: hypothetical protein VMZ52_13370 [Bryobacteraceae bacterium]|nr:hypothetical protein [Bryobacteraceae bacterium]